MIDSSTKAALNVTVDISKNKVVWCYQIVGGLWWILDRKKITCVYFTSTTLYDLSVLIKAY